THNYTLSLHDALPIFEKCYRAHGNELETEYNVVEAGMTAPRVKDEDFVGKEAHLRHRQEEPAAIMCALTVDDHTSSTGEKRYIRSEEHTSELQSRGHL